LNGTFVRDALHRHLPVRPSLASRPLNGVIAIVNVVAKRLPFAVGFMTSARILVYKDVTAAGEEQRGFVAVRILINGRGKPLRTVRRAADDNGELSFDSGPVHIRVENHAVPHGNRNMVLETNVV